MAEDFLNTPILFDRKVDEETGNVYVAYIDPRVHRFGQNSGPVLLRDAPVSVQQQARAFDFLFDRD